MCLFIHLLYSRDNLLVILRIDYRIVEFFLKRCDKSACNSLEADDCDYRGAVYPEVANSKLDIGNKPPDRSVDLLLYFESR